MLDLIFRKKKHIKISRALSNPDAPIEKEDDEAKPWTWIVIDSLIIGFIALGAVMPSTIPTVADCWVMLRAFFIAFILQVAVERGLKPRLGGK